MEEPPKLAPDEQPSPEGFSLLALSLLWKMAQDDPRMAQRLREAGIELQAAGRTQRRV
jgi:hypothetical protein